MSIVVGFAGGIASGKTSISKRISDVVGWSHVGFGDFVRSEATRRAVGSSRPDLQTLGDVLIQEGWDEFCQGVLAQANSWVPGEGLLIDGIRHFEAVRRLRELVKPSRLAVIFVRCSMAERKRRLVMAGVTPDEADELLSHPNEADVPNVERQSDFIADGEAGEDAAVASVIGYLKSKGC